MSNFIRCSDPDTIQKLIKSGFQLLENNNGVAVFVNDAKNKIDFDKSKIAYTNIYTATS